MVTADSVWSLLLACSSCSKVVVTAVGGMITCLWTLLLCVVTPVGVVTAGEEWSL